MKEQVWQIVKGPSIVSSVLSFLNMLASTWSSKCHIQDGGQTNSNGSSSSSAVESAVDMVATSDCTLIRIPDLQRQLSILPHKVSCLLELKMNQSIESIRRRMITVRACSQMFQFLPFTPIEFF